ncbi:MAG TPA: PmoA family protein [Herpetosiphonaceae bacterium]|nr:PmoA family protein [Herpetosiphonaceae bacterium]
MDRRLRIMHEVDRRVTISHGEHVILTYHYDANARYPYCHPVNLPDGPPITLHRPFDHDWHLGMYFSWKYVNGLNVWEGPDSGEAYGLTQHRALEVRKEDGAGAALGHAMTWTTATGEPLLDDDRMVIVRPPRSGNDYCIDWTFRFVPRAETAVLDRKPEWGGYAGLTVRLPRSFVRNRVLNAEKQTTTAETHAARSRWTDYAGRIDGYGRDAWAGVTMIDHPANPRFPNAWLTYDTAEMQFLNAAFVRDEPYTLQRGETLRLAYRVLVHWQAGSGEAIEQEWDAFAATEPHDEWSRLFPSLA